MNDLQATYLETIVGYIINVEDKNNTIQYVVKSEGVNSVSYLGIPVFQFGYNSYKYSEGDRVYCQKLKHQSKLYILGQIPNNKVAVTNGNPMPREGEMLLNSGGANNSGFTGVGTSDNLLIYAGKNKNTTVKLSPFNLRVQSGDSGLLLEKTSFSINLNSINSFSIFDGVATLKAERGIKFYSGNGEFLTTGETFGFYQSNVIPGLKVSSASEKIKIDPKTDYSIYISKSSQFLNASKGIFNYSENFSVKTAGITTGKDAISFQILKGNFKANISNGSFGFNILSPVGNSIVFNIGPNVSPLSTFEITQDSFLMNLSPGSNLKMDNTSFELSIGAISPSSIKIDTTSIVITSQLMGSKGDIKLDGNVEVTGKLIVNDMIYSTDEVYAKATKAGKTMVTASAIGLSTHLTATAVPGPAVPPTVGT